MNLKQLIDECITDWFYNHPDGYAKKPYDIQDLTILSEVLQKRSVDNKTIVEILKTLAEDDIVKNRETGNVYTVKNHNPDTQKLIKKNASPEEIERAKKGSEKDAAPKDDTPEKDSELSPENEKLIKTMEGANGIDKKIASALEKYPGAFGETEKEKVKALENDFKEFLKSPTKEVAEALVKEYKLSTNENGGKLYLGFVVGQGRKALGTGSGSTLSKGMVSAIEQALPEFRNQGDPMKAAKQAVTTTSKPDISGAPSDDTPITYTDAKGNEKTTTAGKAKKAKRGHPAKEAYLKQTSIATADNDETVKEIFNKDPFNYLEPSMHEVFGPKSEDGKLLSNEGGKNAKAYFNQSIQNNTALKSTMNKLEELEQAGTASPEIRLALQEHETKLNEISKEFENMSAEEREKAVQDSYANMAQKMASADPEITNAIFKNVAEMALYDSEIAGGKEAYLPSAGTFPSGDKIRVDRDGKGVVEKIAAVSCKYGKASNGTFGFPGETQQYIKFHPDQSKRDLLNNRVGAPGYALGVKNSVISDSEQFNSIVDESGIGPAIKEGGIEAIRSKMEEVQTKIDQLIGPPPVKKDQLVAKAKELKALNAEVKDTLMENVDLNELETIIGGSINSKGQPTGNIGTFMKGGAQAIGILTFASALRTSNGLETIEHHHQVIDDDGLHMETTAGSPSCRDWNLTDRMFDTRGGGIIAGSVGPGEKE